jgi:hypothetical protein
VVLSSINDCKMVSLPRIIDPRGSLTFLEGGRHVPFEIKRIFYLYDVPTEEGRGAHAHRALQQFLVCLAGSFDVAVDDGEFQARIHLNRPWKGLLIPPMIWAAEVNFDPGSVCLVLASAPYDEADYIRNHAEFLKLRNAQ